MTVLVASAVVWVLIRIPLVIVRALGVVEIVRRDLSPSATGDPASATGDRVTHRPLANRRAAPSAQ